MPPARRGRSSVATNVDDNPISNNSNKRSREKENMPPSRTFSLSSHNEQDQDSPEEEERRPTKSSRPSKPASKTSSVPLKSRSSSKPPSNNTKSKAPNGRASSSKSRAAEQYLSEEEEEEQEDVEEEEGMQQVARLEAESEATDSDQVEEATPRPKGSTSNGRRKAYAATRAGTNGSKVTLASSARSRTTDSKNQRTKIASSLSDAESETSEQEDGEVEVEDHGVDALMDSRAFESFMQAREAKSRSRREKMLEEKLQRVIAERDEVQRQFDELQELRQTRSEKALEEFKLAADANLKRVKALADSYKVRAEAAERRAKEADANGHGNADRSMSIRAASVASSNNAAEDVQKVERKYQRRLAEMEKEVKEKNEENHRLEKQLSQEIQASKKLQQSLASSSNSKMGKAAEAQSQASASAMADEKAVRRLYEDLTGLIINGVEFHDDLAKFRRFKAVFACLGYHDLELSLEESISDLPSDSESNGNHHARQRQDLVYMPQIDKDRDADLVNNPKIPGHFKEPIRFERASAVKFLTSFHKALTRK
ncbi:hypothetical protein IE53DRAFT_378959 [Violaceomyces palustris]|uniref:Uncharacterized protein n=1 Tax=Violaceomyces palustris TaxID=1673888 RepID=A0ACD0P097_9BASI|nr:hypothetical protein IE53DRAFT_378959 [Violaceomyces palustris]